MTEHTMRDAAATPHWAATGSAQEAFAAGGGAIDAAIAAAVTLSVVYPQDCSIGGDLIALVRSPLGETTVVNASGPAPVGSERAVAEAGLSRMPEAGPLTITVPGSLAGLAELHDMGGRAEWADLIAHGARYAREGVPVSQATARFLREGWAELRQDPGFAACFAGPGGAALGEGAMFRQPALAETLERIGRDGADAFYRGPLGVVFAEGLAELGSPLRASDLERYRARREAPISLDWGDYRVHTSGPNTQGAVLLLMLAAIADGELDPDPLGSDIAVLAGLAARASRLRDVLLGDGCALERSALDWREPQRVRALLDASRGLDRSAGPSSGPTAGLRDKRVGGDTVAVVATDREGWSVSLIQSVYEPFGARILEPATGIVCHNRGTSFSLEPGHPNRLADGKRPMHTLMPVIVERGGECFSVQGTMGGKAQPQIHMELLGSLLAGRTAEQAVADPRWVVGGREALASDVAQVERSAAAALAALSPPGVDLVVETLDDLHDAVGHVQAIVYGPDGSCDAVSDPRSDGSAFVMA